MVFSCEGWVWLNGKHRCVVQSIASRFLSTRLARYDTAIFTTFDARHCFSFMFSLFLFFLMEAENIVFGSSQGTLAAISSPLQLSLWIPSTKNIEDLTHFNHPKGYETPQKSGSWMSWVPPSHVHHRSPLGGWGRVWSHGHGDLHFQCGQGWSVRVSGLQVHGRGLSVGTPAKRPVPWETWGISTFRVFQGKQMRNVRKKTWRDATTRQVDCEVWCSKSNVEQYRRDPGKMGYLVGSVGVYISPVIGSQLGHANCLVPLDLLGDDMICKQIGFCWEFWFKLGVLCCSYRKDVRVHCQI